MVDSNLFLKMEMIKVRKKIIIGLATLFLFSIVIVSSVSAFIPMPPPGPKDSDNDGLFDTEETNTYHTDPYDPDTDNDKLNDYKEVKVYRTNPKDKDTDNDGLTDWEDVYYGYNPKVAEATHMFVHNGKVYCGVAYLAWVSDYSNWNYWPYINSLIEIISLAVMNDQLNGDLTLDPLDGSMSARYDYVTALENNGYYVFTAPDFTRDSFKDGFVEAWKFADKYDTRLFATTYTHGLPVNLDIPLRGGTWMTSKSGVCISSGTFANIGLRLIGKKIPEFIYYAAPCFGMTTQAAAIGASLCSHTNKRILFGTYNSGTQSAVSSFRYYALINSQTVRDAYYNSESQNICFLGDTSYILPRI